MEKNSFYFLGQKHGTDKVLHHRYDRFYDVFLSGMREKEIVLLEIGAGLGESFTMWHEYFPFGKIFTMDISSERKEEWGEIFLGDQNSLSDLKRAKEKTGKCDVIVDDGSHVPEHQIESFIYLFQEVLKPGGVYIIEDIECSFWNPQSEVYGYKVGNHNILNFFSFSPYEINSEFSGLKNKFGISMISYGQNCIILTKKTEEEEDFTKREYRFKSLL